MISDTEEEGPEHIDDPSAPLADESLPEAESVSIDTPQPVYTSSVLLPSPPSTEQLDTAPAEDAVLPPPGLVLPERGRATFPGNDEKENVPECSVEKGSIFVESDSAEIGDRNAESESGGLELGDRYFPEFREEDSIYEDHDDVGEDREGFRNDGLLGPTLWDELQDCPDEDEEQELEESPRESQESSDLEAALDEERTGVTEEDAARQLAEEAIVDNAPGIEKVPEVNEAILAGNDQLEQDDQEQVIVDTPEPMEVLVEDIEVEALGGEERELEDDPRSEPILRQQETHRLRTPTPSSSCIPLPLRLLWGGLTIKPKRQQPPTSQNISTSSLGRSMLPLPLRLLWGGESIRPRSPTPESPKQVHPESTPNPDAPRVIVVDDIATETALFETPVLPARHIVRCTPPVSPRSPPRSPPRATQAKPFSFGATRRKSLEKQVIEPTLSIPGGTARTKALAYDAARRLLRKANAAGIAGGAIRS